MRLCGDKPFRTPSSHRHVAPPPARMRAVIVARLSADAERTRLYSSAAWDAFDRRRPWRATLTNRRSLPPGRSSGSGGWSAAWGEPLRLELRPIRVAYGEWPARRRCFTAGSPGPSSSTPLRPRYPSPGGSRQHLEAGGTVEHRFADRAAGRARCRRCRGHATPRELAPLELEPPSRDRDERDSGSSAEGHRRGGRSRLFIVCQEAASGGRRNSPRSSVALATCLALNGHGAVLDRCDASLKAITRIGHSLDEPPG